MKSTLLQVGPVLAGSIFMLMLVRRRRLDREKIGLVTPQGAWLLLVGAFAVYLGLLELVSFKTGLLDHQVRPWMFNTPEVIVRVIGIVLLTPFLEETIFRGVLQSEIRERAPLGFAIVGQALVFTAFHGLTLMESKTVVFDIAQLFLEGVFYGWVRYKTGSLYPSMVMHGLGNSVAVLERLLM